MAYGGNEEVRQSEFNELSYKMLRIHKLQDRLNILWSAPKEKWINDSVIHGGPEYGFVLIASNLISLYREVRPKCTPDEKKEADDLRDKISEEVEEGEDSIFDSVPNYDSPKLVYNHQKYLTLKKRLMEFSDMVSDLLDAHGFNPDKDGGLRGL